MFMKTKLVLNEIEDKGAPRTRHLKMITATLGAVATLARWAKRKGQGVAPSLGAYPKGIQECCAKVRKRIAKLLESQKEGTLRTTLPMPDVVMGNVVLDIIAIAELHDWLMATGRGQYELEERQRKEAWHMWVMRASATKPG